MDWFDYLMGFAEHAAKKSKDGTQVGAVLVDPNNSVRITAYNGPARGLKDSEDRFERPKKYFFACHSEANIVSFAARAGIPTDGCTVFVTHAPCASCANTMVQAGIKRVVYGPGTTSMPKEHFDYAQEIMAEAGVEALFFERIKKPLDA